MDQRRLRAVLWDFDGTLVNSEPMWIEHEKDMLARHGASWPEEQFKAQIGEPATVTAQRISESCAGAITVAQAYEELHARICARFEAGEIPFLPGARELLTDIRAHGVPCAMYTSSNKRIMSVIARVVPEFEFIVDGDDVKNPKPDPEGYLQAMRRLGVGPEEVVIIEDSVPGTDAASATGAVVLAVPLLGRPGAAPRRVLREGGLTGLDFAGLEKIWRNQW